MKQSKIRKMLRLGWESTLQTTNPDNKVLCQAIRDILTVKKDVQSR